MRFQDVAKVFSQIEATTLRNEKTKLLAQLLEEVNSQDLGPICYLSVGRLGPLYDPIEFNLAGKMAVRAVAWGAEKPVEEVGRDYKDGGDLGDVVERYFTKKESEKTVGEVYGELRGVAEDSGVGSQERKVRRLGKLLRELDKLSAKYVARLVVGKLRLGFSDVTVLDALSVMKKGDKTDRKALEGAFNVRADLAEVAEIYKMRGVAGIEEVGVEPGVPIRPAKAERLGTMSEIVEKLGEMSVEPKYDGMRVQIHAYRGTVENGDQGGLFEESEDGHVVKIFSRSMEDISHMFPDIVKAARKILDEFGKDFVMDAEAIGVDPKEGGFLSFQETIKRKRKHGVGEKLKEIPLKVLVFDLLYVGGDGLLEKEYKTRRELLAGLLGQGGVIVVAESHVVSSVEEAEKYFREYVGDGLEGMMCKKLDSVYQAGARNFNWVKYKKAHESQLTDTLDCVVMGYYAGKGKRKNFGLGAFLVGVMNRDDKYETVAKVGTGLTDLQWREMWERMQSWMTEKKPGDYQVAKGLEPDGWVEPRIVVEIEADEVTKSPIHSAGYALRFPRLLRFRDDKNVHDITKRQEVKDIFGMKKAYNGGK